MLSLSNNYYMICAVAVHAMVPMWWSENNYAELVLSFHMYMGTGA